MMRKGRWVKPAPRYGENHHNWKITDADVKEIRRRYVPGKRGLVKNLAAEFSVDRHTIAGIAAGRLRKGEL